MGMFDDAPQIQEEQPTEEIKPKEVKEVSEQPITDRAEQMTRCIKDARIAYTEAKENPSSEDIRAVAISFYIDEGKNGRVTQIRQDRGYTKPTIQAGQNTSSPVPQTGQQLPYFKFADHENQDVTLKVISDDGEYQVRGKMTHGFTIEVEGVEYKLSTTSKVLLPRLVVGETITVKMFKEAGTNGITYTKYEVK